jgi:hypothetical protein
LDHLRGREPDEIYRDMDIDPLLLVVPAVLVRVPDPSAAPLANLESRQSSERAEELLAGGEPLGFVGRRRVALVGRRVVAVRPQKIVSRCQLRG